MDSELLSVCIPTWNRASFLRDLLAGFSEQIRADKLTPADVAFYVSDNASEDDTGEVCNAFARQVPQTRYVRNPANIGGDQNILKVRTYAQGRYIWALGDDELLADKALVNLLRLLREQQPALVISYTPNYQYPLPEPQMFSDYKAFARECIRVNPHALAEHTLISANIYRADCFDFDFARASMGATCYPHMFALLRPVLRLRGQVVLPDFPIMIMRDQRAPVGGDGNWGDCIDGYWISYFEWLRNEMQMPELDPRGPSEVARRALLRRMFRHPLKLLLDNRHALFQPSAYRWAFDRVFRIRRTKSMEARREPTPSPPPPR